MVHLRIETFIAAPIERVFDLARDLDFHTVSMEGTGEEAVGGRTTGLIEAGEEVEWRARHLGVKWRLRSRIASMDRPRSFTDVQVKGPFASYEHHHLFTPRDGGTLMVDDIAYRAPLGPLGRLAEWLVLARHMRRLLEARGAAIKGAAEGSGDRA